MIKTLSDSDSFAKLRYKMKGNSSPQGKERVYFTCHPEDFEACFDSICQDIFETQNCAIYYKDDLNATLNIKEMETDLGRMQLFVIPITSKFLYQDNVARDVEFRFAVEHHIPILPLLQEGGLDSEFNRICGDLQFLDKNILENDPTALSYEKKLENFLASVLLGDELAAQVRDAFDAYIFMSYRKQDRKYAQELMHLIHKNDFCRDIAIWYDEFLVPGENFNQAIRDAMEKSELFTFVVTPNILEPNNYVMEIEYPEARNVGKPILPVEMEPTDRKMLNEYFKNIPNPTDVRDVQALTDDLIEKISRLDIKENNSDPIHLFFIGLAYLSGIDMEVDYERAVNLITTAAETNLPEAMQKLSDMYKNGEGVERDYEASVMWLEKLAEYWEKKFAESGLEADGNKYYSALWNVGDAWYAMRQLSQSRTAYEKMLSIANCLFEKFGGIDKRHKEVVSYSNLGDVSREEGNLNEAEKWYRKSLALCEELNCEMCTVESRRECFVGYIKLGRINWIEENLDDAKEWYRKSLKISEELSRETCTVQARLDLSAGLDLLGIISYEEGNLDEAKEWFWKSLEQREGLRVDADTVEARQGLIVSYDNLGNIFLAEGRLSEAKEWFQKSLALSEELNVEKDTVEAQRNLLINYNYLGNISREEGKLSEAKEWFWKCLNLSEKLKCETGTTEACRDLSVNYNKLGQISKEEGNLSEARKWHQKALKLCEKLNHESDTRESRRDLSVCYDFLGSICQIDGSISEAKVWYRKGLVLREKLSRETGTAKAFNDVAVSYYQLGIIDINHPDVLMLRKAESIWMKLLDSCPQVACYANNLQMVQKLLKETEYK